MGSSYGKDRLVRYVSIDPGSMNLGLSIIDIDLDRTMTIRQSMTLDGEYLSRRYPLIAEIHSDRYARLAGLESAILDIFHYWQPDFVMSEGAFFNPRRPNAYATLIEVINMIRRAVMTYSLHIGLEVIDPSTLKKTIGVKGGSNEKEDMRKAISKLIFIEGKLRIGNPEIDIAALSEHSIDSLAGGYCFGLRLLKAL